MTRKFAALSKLGRETEGQGARSGACLGEQILHAPLQGLQARRRSRGLLHCAAVRGGQRSEGWGNGS